MSIRIGSRIFAPRLFTTLLAIVLIASLISLGRWQLRRADEKRALFDSFAAGTDATQSIDLRTPPVRRYRHIEAAGHYDQTRQILIDNMVHAERAGYFVITPFALAGGGWVLVNRGWVPLGASRAEIARLLGESSWTSAADLVLLDPGEPDGYVRDWSPPGFPPMRHIGYAVQWFAMAATLLVIWVVTNLKRLGGAGERSSDPTGVSK